MRILSRHSRSQDSPASFEDVENRSLLHVAQASRPGHAVTFHKAVQDHRDLFEWEPYVGREWPSLWLRETLTALLALETLNSVLAV